MLQRLQATLVKCFCTDSIDVMSFLKCGDQIEVLYSSFGRTYVTKALSKIQMLRVENDLKI